MEPKRIDPRRLLEFGTAVYMHAGMPEADARLAADTLVQADLWGHQSHGVMRLGWYTTCLPSYLDQSRSKIRPALLYRS